MGFVTTLSTFGRGTPYPVLNEYFENLCAAMKMLSDNGCIFTGQTVRDAGTAMNSTFRDVPIDQRIEMPIFESTQLGMATGISLTGQLVCTCYPRINFMLEAIPQLVQHLDKIPLFSDYKPKVIIRTSIATINPLDPGPQHIGNYTDAIEAMLSTVKVVRLHTAEQIVPAYKDAMQREGSTLLVEWVEKYHA
jgi:pyruvate/2-oxoglutarate/acetoin dehydrogenase E1 component